MEGCGQRNGLLSSAPRNGEVDGDDRVQRVAMGQGPEMKGQQSHLKRGPGHVREHPC